MKRRKTLKTGKAISMKKATYETIKKELVDRGYTDADVLAELDAEINRGAEEKAAKAAQYEGVHSLIVDNLSATPVTASALWAEVEEEFLKTGMTKGQFQHALTHMWQDEIGIDRSGKVNTYFRK